MESKVVLSLVIVLAIEHALGADSPMSGFFVKLRERAAQAQRYLASVCY